MKSFKVGVKTNGDTDWVSNGLRFATEEEAKAYGENLFMRWTAVNEWTVLPSTDPVNYTFHNHTLTAVEAVA